MPRLVIQYRPLDSASFDDDYLVILLQVKKPATAWVLVDLKTFHHRRFTMYEGADPIPLFRDVFAYVTRISSVNVSTGFDAPESVNIVRSKAITKHQKEGGTHALQRSDCRVSAKD